MSIQLGGAVAVYSPTRLERVPMSFEEFEGLPGDVFAEYVDGCAVVSPPPDFGHQALATDLAILLAAALPATRVVVEAGLRTVRDGHRIPDVMVLPQIEDSVWAEQTPILAVEVSSPSTRAEDLFRKSSEYQAAGVGQYWIVDRAQRTVTVLRNAGTEWVVLLDLDGTRPTGEVMVGEHGVVRLDLGELFADL